jgi:hypothetical protein
MPIIASRASAAYGLGFGKVTTTPDTPIGSYFPLATIKLASTTTSFSFTGITPDFKHLEIRYQSMTDRPTYGYDPLQMWFNSDTSNAYPNTFIRGTGANGVLASGSSSTSGTPNFYMDWGNGTTVGPYPSNGVITIFDANNASKYKTMHSKYGVDLNGTLGGAAGSVNFFAGTYFGTAPVTSIHFNSYLGNSFIVGTQFSLYGIK